MPKPGQSDPKVAKNLCSSVCVGRCIQSLHIYIGLQLHTLKKSDVKERKKNKMSDKRAEDRRAVFGFVFNLSPVSEGKYLIGSIKRSKKKRKNSSINTAEDRRDAL